MSPTLVKQCPLQCLYIYMYRTSFRKCPCILIHWTASILLSVIQFRKCHHLQIIQTVHLPTSTSMCTLLTTHDSTAVLVQLGQAESVNYSYSELNYVSAKTDSFATRSVHCGKNAIWRGPRQLRLCIASNNATDIELHVHTYAVNVADHELHSTQLVKAHPTMCCICLVMILVGRNGRT